MRILVFIGLVLLGSCAKESIYKTIHSNNQLAQFASSTESKFSPCCAENLSYAPDSSYYDHYDERTLRINIHYMASEDSTVGFDLKTGKEYMYHLVKNANSRLKENHKMKLPVGNDTESLQPFYQYKVTGLNKEDDGQYVHHDDELYYFINKGKNRNNYNKDVIKKYEVGGDSILNLFIMPHHPDSVISKTYRPHGTGIALNSSLKMAGLYEHPDNPWGFATLLNHEVGHILGLRHSWSGNDGCDDTPKHPNCWGDDPNKENCEVASNNVMDYNNSQMAITPCQLGIIHKNFAVLNSRQRKFLKKDWCRLDTSKTIIVNDHLEWKGARDLSRNIVIKDGGKLHVYCRVSLPPDAQIVVEPGGSLILENARLHNDCGESWQGIKLMKKAKKKASLKTIGSVSIENVFSQKS